MKRILFLTFLVSSFSCIAQSGRGSMDCTVTGNVVVSSEEGKFKNYSGIKDGVKANEKVMLNYNVGSDRIYIDLNRDNKEKNIIINQYLSTQDNETIAKKGGSGGFFIESSIYNHSVSFMPDYIRINNFAELVLRRYYKNDWHGIYSNVITSEMTTHTLTLNCIHNNDNMDSAFKIFTAIKNK